MDEQPILENAIEPVPQRRKRLLIIGVLLVVIILAATGIVYWRHVAKEKLQPQIPPIQDSVLLKKLPASAQQEFVQLTGPFFDSFEKSTHVFDSVNQDGYWADDEHACTNPGCKSILLSFPIHSISIEGMNVDEDDAASVILIGENGKDIAAAVVDIDRDNGTFEKTGVVPILYFTNKQEWRDTIPDAIKNWAQSISWESLFSYDGKKSGYDGSKNYRFIMDPLHDSSVLTDSPRDFKWANGKTDITTIFHDGETIPWYIPVVAPSNTDTYISSGDLNGDGLTDAVVYIGYKSSFLKEKFGDYEDIDASSLEIEPPYNKKVLAILLRNKDMSFTVSTVNVSSVDLEPNGESYDSSEILPNGTVEFNLSMGGGSCWNSIGKESFVSWNNSLKTWNVTKTVSTDTCDDPDKEPKKTTTILPRPVPFEEYSEWAY